MKDLKELGYKPGEVRYNTFVYIDKRGRLSGMECAPDARPSDYGAGGYYPSRSWIDEFKMSMMDAYNRGLE